MKTVLMLPLTALGLRLVGFNRWYAGLARLTKQPNPVTLPSDLGGVGGGQPEKEATIRRTLRVMRLAVRRGFYAGNCLSRSLTLWWLLHHQGITSDLRIGVRKKEAGRLPSEGHAALEGQFEAHAWVEVEGYPLNENEHVHQRYVAFEQAIVPKGAIIRHQA